MFSKCRKCHVFIEQNKFLMIQISKEPLPSFKSLKELENIRVWEWRILKGESSGKKFWFW